MFQTHVPARLRLLCLTLGLAGLTASGLLAQEPATPAQPAPAPDAVVATINGQTVTEADLALAASDLDQQFERLPPEQRRAAALSAIIEIRLLSEQAKAKGLDQNGDFQRRMAFLQNRALHSALVDAEVAASITDAEIQARYDSELASTPPANEIRARHILVATEDEAKAIIVQLDGGADFEAIAKEKSSDPGSGAQGGDLGYFGPGQMVPEFDAAAQALDIGAYTKTPVQSQFGFHVIRVEDKRAQQPPAFDQVKEQLRSALLREKYFELVKSLRASATVDVPDPALKAAIDQIEGAK